MDQPGKEGLPILLVVSWTGKKCFFPCPRSRLRIWARETGSAIRSRVSLLIGTGCTVIWSLHSLRTHSMYGWMDGHHIYSKGKDQPVKVASPARGQLNRKNCFFPCPRLRLKIWSRETGSAVPSRVSLLISILRLNLVADWASTSMVANNNPARVHACKNFVSQRQVRPSRPALSCSFSTAPRLRTLAVGTKTLHGNVLRLKKTDRCYILLLDLVYSTCVMMHQLVINITSYYYSMLSRSETSLKCYSTYRGWF